MIYQCFYCKDMYDENDGVMLSKEQVNFMSLEPVMVFKCIECMTDNDCKKFKALKKKIKEKNN